MINQFEKEQQIMICWNITADLREINEQLMESRISVDVVSNLLLKKEKLYEIKFNKLFTIFEHVISEGV